MLYPSSLSCLSIKLNEINISGQEHEYKDRFRPLLY
jgi:hypothetical protein